MPVAIRKRSWEEHVTHASGLQYSYDDLDLVCCHGVDVRGSWLGEGSSKQGQRTRCASMPEGCPQLPTEELSQTIQVAATVTNDESKVFKLMQNNVNVPLDLEEESAHSAYDLVDVDIPQWASESEHLQTTNLRSHGGPHCNQYSGLCVQNVAREIVRMRTTSGEDKIATEGHNIGQDYNVIKCSHISHKEQQRISVPSNNEPLLTGDQLGRHPDQQKTMENHTEGYRRPPEPFDITLNQSSAAGIESPNGLPDAEGEKISTSEQADARLIPPFGEQGQTESTMENGDETTQVSTAMEPVTTLVEEVRGIQSRSSDSNRNLDGLNPDPQTENVELECNIQNEEEGKQSCYGCKTKQNEERAELRFGVDASSDNCSNKKVDTGCLRGAKETYLETVTSARDKEGGRSAFNVLACHENEIVAPQFENNWLKLDTIPEVSHNVLHDTPVHACKDSNFTPNPDVQQPYVDDNYITTEKVSQNLPLCSAEDCNELSPQRLHSNQEASVCDFSKSPGSEMTDQAGAQKESDVIKVRTKKVRLFSTRTNFR